MTERFTLLSELGRGGMGVVWKARDEETGQIVALKLLRETYAEDPEYLARFERELELARRIDSAHVVKVLGFGVRQKVPYLALEYVDGPSLHDALVTHGPYDWIATKALLGQIAQGLADANAAGVIHRDVKPSNVLIGPDGVAKLTDFGIARGLDLTRFTATSTILGTPAYLAPEGPKDARSDLYSLGVIGYELLTGAVPFRGTSYQEVIVEHIRTAPDLAKLPEEARPIIGWLLAKDPAERPQRASALLPMLWGEATQSPMLLAPQPLPRPPLSSNNMPAAASSSVSTGRKPTRLMAGFGAAGIALCLVSVAIAGVFASSKSAPAPVLATNNPSASDAAMLATPVFTPTAPSTSPPTPTPTPTPILIPASNSLSIDHVVQDSTNHAFVWIRYGYSGKPAPAGSGYGVVVAFVDGGCVGIEQGGAVLQPGTGLVVTEITLPPTSGGAPTRACHTTGFGLCAYVFPEGQTGCGIADKHVTYPLDWKP
jgi:serine/threonine protein kinase